MEARLTTVKEEAARNAVLVPGSVTPKKVKTPFIRNVLLYELEGGEGTDAHKTFVASGSKAAKVQGVYHLFCRGHTYNKS